MGDVTNPMIKAEFSAHMANLDAKHDRRERLVKLSRDVTIHSKRAIFLLLRCPPKGNADKTDVRERVIAEAKTKINEVHALIGCIAEELEHDDYWKFARAFSPGMQEFIEAASLMEYLEHERVLTWEKLQADLANLPRSSGASSADSVDKLGKGGGGDSRESAADDGSADGAGTAGADAPAGEEEAAEPAKTICMRVTLNDYVLGISDLTGELMRYAINCVVCDPSVWRRRLFDGLYL